MIGQILIEAPNHRITEPRPRAHQVQYSALSSDTFLIESL